MPPVRSSERGASADKLCAGGSDGGGFRFPAQEYAELSEDFLAFEFRASPPFHAPEEIGRVEQLQVGEDEFGFRTFGGMDDLVSVFPLPVKAEDVAIGSWRVSHDAIFARDRRVVRAVAERGLVWRSAPGALFQAKRISSRSAMSRFAPGAGSSGAGGDRTFETVKGRLSPESVCEPWSSRSETFQT